MDLSKKTAYIPSDKDREFILRVYTDFIYDRVLRTQPQSLLDGRTLQEFWDDSEKDYNVLVGPEDINDPVTPYSSGISRDKANVFISTLTQQLLYPSVAAQNWQQEVDQVMSRVSRAILEWQYNNDGKPAESGLQKSSRYIHKSVVTGTVHVQDDIDKKGRLVSTLVPNEEVYVPNLYQPNIQLQSHVLRMQNAVNYSNAEMEFGMLKKFQDHVVPMSSAQFMLMEESEYRKLHEAINPKDAVHILRCWYDVPEYKIDEYKLAGKLPKFVERAKYFNIIVNGVLLFDSENLMPYYHGFYPISKGIFEYFSNPDFYYGNSMPNKARHDKKWLDGWKQLIRYKAKLSTIPPLVTFNGTFVDADIVVPGMISAAPSGMTKDDIQAIPGISNGITNGDISVMQDGVSDIDRATTAPSSGGNTPNDRATARGRLIDEANAQKMLQGFGMQIGYLVEARTYPILKMSYQFLPRTTLNKIAVPNQSMPGGSSGTMDIIFMPPTEMTKEEEYQANRKIYMMEKESSKKGAPKKIVFVNSEYAQNLDFYLKSVPDELVRETKAIREARSEMKFNNYVAHPEIFNTKNAGKRLVMEYGDDPSEMILEEPPMLTPEQAQAAQIPGGAGPGSGSGQKPLSKMAQQQSSRVTDNSSPLPTY